MYRNFLQLIYSKGILNEQIEIHTMLPILQKLILNSCLAPFSIMCLKILSSCNYNAICNAHFSLFLGFLG